VGFPNLGSHIIARVNNNPGLTEESSFLNDLFKISLGRGDSGIGGGVEGQGVKFPTHHSR